MIPSSCQNDATPHPLRVTCLLPAFNEAPRIGKVLAVVTGHPLIDEVIGYLGRINPDFRPDWVLARHCHRYEFAQTICPPGFQAMLPPMRTPLDGFFMADTAYYYPEDRSICESVKVGSALAREALAG